MIQKKHAEKCEVKPSEAAAASGSEGAASKPPESGKPEDKTVGEL